MARDILLRSMQLGSSVIGNSPYAEPEAKISWVLQQAGFQLFC